jgi:tetratricopeptide (TPR) repeat protein
MTPKSCWLFSLEHSRFLLLVLLLLGLGSQALPAQSPKIEAAIRPMVLGRLKLSTSTTSVEAHQAFVTGVLLLHLFEYRLARVEFRRAQQLDPSFGLAYWGEAMALNHAIWGEQDLVAARAVLLRFGPDRTARLARISDQRERGFFAAVEALYGDGTKVERDRAHARAMETLARHNPDDDEVQLFYALALFGKHAGVRDVPDYMRAAAIAQRVFTRNPLHPGAAHYLIHGVDDSTHAPLGVDAARALSRVAPDSPHALHMTSHIFLMLGLWADVVAANEASSAAANNWCDIRGVPQQHYGHTNFWLEYAYLQQGRHVAAKALLLLARKESLDPSVPPPPVNQYDPDDSVQGSLVQMWSRYLLETGDWQDEIADWTFPLGDALDPNLTYAWTQGFRRTRLGDSEQAARWLERFVATRVVHTGAQQRTIHLDGGTSVVFTQRDLHGVRIGSVGSVEHRSA